MYRVFKSGKDQAITSQQHVDANISGDLEVIVRESADQQDVVNMLLRIAALIDVDKAASAGN